MTIDYNYLKDYLMFEEIMRHLNDGINVVDKNGVLIYANKMSADYAGAMQSEMIGRHITDFYKEAVLLNVLRTKKACLDKKIHYVGDKKYLVNSYPIFRDGEFEGAYSIFKDIRDIEDLNNEISDLKLHLAISEQDENLLEIIGHQDSLIGVIDKAKRTVGALGGPRHSLITGESGTGKTLLAKHIYNYARKIGAIDLNAPFIEINCAQFTNPDIAAVEIFGSESGAYTGAKQKKGLFEQAHGGILFLDEAHALNEYQNLLLKTIETGYTRRIGGTSEIQANVIIIAASTRDLKTYFLPELYQRLAQYEIHMPSLKERTTKEKEELLDYFIKKYESSVHEIHNLNYKVIFSDEAKALLMKAHYPRNIRQFRDVINFSIDSASPLIDDLKHSEEIKSIVEAKHIPFESIDQKEDAPEKADSKSSITDDIGEKIKAMSKEGLGPRKISSILKDQGITIEYYQVAYYLKKHDLTYQTHRT